MQLSKQINFDVIDSTNNYLKENYLKLNSLTFVKTNYQTNGRGQFERHWESKSNLNLLFSCLLKDIKIEYLNDIKENVKNSLIKLLKSYSLSPRFKIPNDIYIDDQKILGILIETKITNNNLDYVVIGIGLNVNQTEFIDPRATSLKLLLNKELNIEEVYEKFVKIFLEEMRNINV